MELESVKSSWAITILRLCLTTIIAGSIPWSTFEDSYPNCSGLWLSSFFPFRHSQNRQFHGRPNFLANQHQSLRFPLDSRSLFEFQGSRMLHWFMKFMKASKSMQVLWMQYCTAFAKTKRHNTHELSEFIACLACCCFTSHSHWYARHLCQCLVTRGRLRAVSTLQFGVNT